VHRLAVFSLRNRALIALVTIVIAVFGGVSLTQLKQELVPSISYPGLFIVTTYPGASPAVVEHDVSTPIEQAIQTVPGLESTSATSSANFSNITASFAYSTDLATAEQKITTAINRIKSSLPDGVDPQVLQFNLSDLPIVQLAVTSDLDATELSDRLDRIAVPELSRLDGVASVGLQGAAVDRVEIVPNAEDLAAWGLTTQSITQTLDANGVLLPAGEITEDGKTLSVQAGTRLTSTDQIADLPILGARPVDPSRTGQIVTIGDVAEVSVQPEAPKGFSRVNGSDALTLWVTKTAAGNTVAVSGEVLAALPDLAESIGGGTEFVVVFDQAPFITQSIESLAQEGLLGLVFAVIVILVFLLSLRSTLVTAVSIPTSVLVTFIGIWVSGYTLNVITLAGLTIAIARAVDDSIVVIENIKRHLESGTEKRQAILTAVREVAGAITASTVTTVAVFLPLAFVGDQIGELFRPFAMTVAIALFASLIVSLTIVPVLAYWFLGRRKQRDQDAAATPTAGEQTDSVAIVDEHSGRLAKAYSPIIRWTLKHPVVVVLVALLVLGGSAALAPLLKFNFISDSGQNTMTVTQTLPSGTSLAVQDDAAREVEQVLAEVPGVKTVQTSVGSGGSVLRSALGSGGTTFSITTDPSYDQVALQDEVRNAVASLSGAGEISLSASSGFGSSTLDVTVRAATQADLETATQLVVDAVKGLDVTKAVEDNVATTTPYISVEVDLDAAAKAGLTELQVGGLVMAAMNPNAVGDVLIDERTLSIYLVDTDAPTTVAELRDFEVPTRTGLKPLHDLASISTSLAPATITTEQGVRVATVSITPATDDIAAASAQVTTAIDELELPSGTSAELGGVATQMADAFGQLSIALLAAILIVYVVMVATFRSLRQPLLLLVSVPFAATGAIVLQVVTGVPLGVSSLIGVLMLVGIVVTNAIVLVDLINQYRARGLKIRTAVELGTERRLRPILMTAAATIFALVPLAVGITGHGGFISQPLAIIVIGGLVSSTVLTLIVLPSLYYLVEGRKERKADRRARLAAVDAHAEEHAEPIVDDVLNGHVPAAVLPAAVSDADAPVTTGADAADAAPVAAPAVVLPPQARQADARAAKKAERDAVKAAKKAERDAAVTAARDAKLAAKDAKEAQKAAAKAAKAEKVKASKAEKSKGAHTAAAVEPDAPQGAQSEAPKVEETEASTPTESSAEVTAPTATADPAAAADTESAQENATEDDAKATGAPAAPEAFRPPMLPKLPPVSNLPTMPLPSIGQLPPRPTPFTPPAPPTVPPVDEPTRPADPASESDES